LFVCVAHTDVAILPVLLHFLPPRLRYPLLYSATTTTTTT